MKPCGVCGTFKICYCRDEIIFKLFILNFYFPKMQIDEYMYNHFHKKDYYLAQAMFDAFPENETCSDIYTKKTAMTKYERVTYNYIE